MSGTACLGLPEPASGGAPAERCVSPLAHPHPYLSLDLSALHPRLSSLSLSLSLWVPVSSPWFFDLTCLRICVSAPSSVSPFLLVSLSPSLSPFPSPCPLHLCVHSSSGSLTARIQLQFIIWSRAHGASGPRTWWCQCWGGRGTPSSRPGCRTCCDEGWCGLPRAQVTEVGRLRLLGPGDRPSSAFLWYALSRPCMWVLVSLSLLCLYSPVCLWA